MWAVRALSSGALWPPKQAPALLPDLAGDDLRDINMSRRHRTRDICSSFFCNYGLIPVCQSSLPSDLVCS